MTNLHKFVLCWVEFAQTRQKRSNLRKFDQFANSCQHIYVDPRLSTGPVYKLGRPQIHSMRNEIHFINWVPRCETFYKRGPIISNGISFYMRGPANFAPICKPAQFINCDCPFYKLELHFISRLITESICKLRHLILQTGTSPFTNWNVSLIL